MFLQKRDKYHSILTTIYASLWNINKSVEDKVSKVCTLNEKLSSKYNSIILTGKVPLWVREAVSQVLQY